MRGSASSGYKTLVLRL